MKCALPSLLAAALLFTGCGERYEPEPHEGVRIVTLAPNVAEILFELGLGDQVVGVSRFTAYPPEAAARPAVGGTYDPSYERILSLQPDWVVGLDTQHDIARQLQSLGIRFLGLPHERITDVLDAIRQAGEIFGAEEQAAQGIARIERAIAAARARTDVLTDRPAPRILVCVGHDDAFNRLYVAGRNTLYDDLIHLAGGVNACQITSQPYPEISREGLVAMAPDALIIIAPDQPTRGSTPRMPFPIIHLTEPYVSIPGPRIDKLLDDFVQIIHDPASL